MADNKDKDISAYEREKQEFVDGLRQFHSSRGTPIDKLPRIGTKEIDLYLLYQRVTELGGWKKVNDHQLWEKIYKYFRIPQACLHGDQVLKHIYIRYLNLYEKINFLGEDPNQKDGSRDEEGPLRKKQCGPKYGVHLSYNYAQHEIAENLRGGYGLSTDYANFSDYDKLEKALLSGMPNEVDFVVNVCTLLSNESKHTLQLGKSRHLTDLLLAHIGIFKEGDLSFEKLYENGWKQYSNRDFVKFWFDTVKDEQIRRLISFTRKSTRKKLTGDEILQVGRDLGVEDKEGIRITQMAIIFRNLSFDEDNMKYLASNDLVFRFLMLCIHCNYGALRQLGLDTIGNLAAQMILEPIDSWRSEMLVNLLLQCLTSKDKFAVVRGLEMVSKLSQLVENEYVLSEKLDTSIYEEIAKYLTIQDIQLIVSSLEALYQLSELGEATTSKIAEVSNTVDTLVSLITVEAQSYGPNSLVGIKVVEYCPPPHLTGGVTEGVGPPVSQAQPPGPPTSTPQQTTTAVQQKTKPSVITTSVPVVTTAGAANQSQQAAKPGIPDMDTTTCNWLQATYEVSPDGMMSQLELYTDYLEFCKKQTLTQALQSQKFLQTVRVVFPKSCIATGARQGGKREVCIRGIKKRQQQLPFAISCQVARVSVASPSVPRSSNTLTHAPTLLQRLTEPLKPPKRNTTSLCPVGGALQQTVSPDGGVVTSHQPQQTLTTQPTYSVAGSIPAQGHIPITKPAATSTPVGKPVKAPVKRSGGKGKKSAKNILPRPEQAGKQVGNFPTIVPKNLSNTQYTTQDVVYSTIDPQTNAETKVMVKTLLAKKLRQGNVIITQPGVVSIPEINSGQYQSENQVQLQYQTPYSQPVQQTTYIQYNSPATQNSVQTIVQPNQTSQLQTFVVQPQVFVQSHPQSSSLQQQQFIQQPIIQQQPVVAQQHIITQQQQPIMAQQQTVYTQQPYVAQQQVITPQVITQPQYVTTYQPQISASFPESSVSSSLSEISQGAESASQIYTHSSQPSSSNQNFGSQSDSPKAENPADLEVCGEIEKAKDIIQEGEEATIEKVENKIVSGQSQNSDTSEISNKPSSNDIKCELLQSENVNEPSDQNDTVHEQKQIIESEPDKTLLIDTKAPESNNQNGLDISSNQNGLDISSAESELESAVGSILDDTQYDNSETVTHESVFQSSNQNFSEVMETEEEEPVMIENDGNELMFESCYSGQTDNEVSDYAVDNPEKDLIEAAAAIEQLEKSEHDQGADSVETEADVAVPVTQQTDLNESVEQGQEYFAVETDNGKVNMVNGDLAKETNRSDITSCLSKFRTDIVVPSIAENGLYEQDFEARMAVENLLKDVEFHVNGDDLSPEENITVFPCQEQSDPPSVQTVNSAADDNFENVNENSQENTISSVDKANESQSNNSNSNYVNGIEATKPPKSLKTINHVSENGNHKPLMNGDINSPEHQSDLVPSPTEETKVVNCISEDKDISRAFDKVSKLNGVVNHKIAKNQVLEVNNVASCNSDTQMEVDSSGIDSNIDKAQGDILAQSILVNDIQPSDADIPDPEPALIPVVKQFVPNQIIGNIMTVNCVQINNNAMSMPVGVSNCIAFTNNPLITSKVQLSSPVSVYSSQKYSTSDSAVIYNKSTSAVNTDLKVIIAGKHSSSSSKGSKDKSLTSPDSRPKSGDGKKSKAKKRSRSKSGGNSDSRPSSSTSSSSTPAPVPEYMCEWSQCRRCFDSVKTIFCHICTVHLKTEFDGLCKWEGCESLIRKRWSLFTHIQDHHCAEQALRSAAQRRLQAFQSGQSVQNPSVPAMVYPADAAIQAIRRFIPKPPYPEFLEGREGPVTKHIRLTSALILRNLARYSPAGRSLLKKHERVISYTCMSAVESSTALANCLYEIMYYS